MYNELKPLSVQHTIHLLECVLGRGLRVVIEPTGSTAPGLRVECRIIDRDFRVLRASIGGDFIGALEIAVKGQGDSTLPPEWLPHRNQTPHEIEYTIFRLDALLLEENVGIAFADVGHSIFEPRPTVKGATECRLYSYSRYDESARSEEWFRQKPCMVGFADPMYGKSPALQAAANALNRFDKTAQRRRKDGA